MDMQMIKALIEALRTEPSGLRRVYKGGQLARTEQSPLFGKNIVQRAGDDVNYMKYRRMQERMGETPLSYDEFMGQ